MFFFESDSLPNLFVKLQIAIISKRQKFRNDKLVKPKTTLVLVSDVSSGYKDVV